MTDNVQYFKQGAGACHDDGSTMESGWYWVRQRPCADPSLPPIPYGPSVGPFRSERDAKNDYALIIRVEDGSLARVIAQAASRKRRGR
jgi:hypothetical protein